MLSNDRKEILLMNPVRVNLKMNKFKKNSDADKNSSLIMSDEADMNYFMSVGGSSGGGMNMSVWDGIPFDVKRSFTSKSEKLIAEMWLKLRMMFTKSPNGTPADFFKSVKDSLTDADIKVANEEDFISKLKELEASKQNFAAGLLKQSHKVSLDEKKAFDAGYKEYITEQDLLKFIKKTRKGLCIEEVEYFRYEIPSDVAKKIAQADKECIFDNFYIFHYDPKAEYNLFYDEKDPIVFGVIFGSNKLFFIADWISEYCDLTYDKLIKTIGK
jgi:hypothetical protein